MLISLLLVLALMVLVSVPVWPYSRAWGYFPCVGIGALLLMVTVLGWLQIF